MWFPCQHCHRVSTIKWFTVTGVTCLVAVYTTTGAVQAAPPPWSTLEFRHRAPVQSASDPYAKPEPAYAKWGRLAVSETKKRYPQAQVVDYLHIGRVEKSKNLAEECFKLWLRFEHREFGVYVTVVIDKHTDRVQLIQFRESPK